VSIMTAEEKLRHQPAVAPDPDPPPPVVTVLSLPGGPAVAERERFTRILTATCWRDGWNEEMEE